MLSMQLLHIKFIYNNIIYYVYNKDKLVIYLLINNNLGYIMTNQDNTTNKDQKTGNQGFASMDKDKQKEIASQGGKASGESKNDDHNKDHKDTSK